MAVKGLFKVVSEVRFRDELSVVKAQTQSGKGVAQRRGPYKYGFEVRIPDCIQHSEQHVDLLEQLASTEYGTNTFKSGLPAGVTKNRGSWNTTPGSPTVNENTAVNGTTVDCDGAPSNISNYARALDFVQFTGDDKVYQITEDVDTNATGDFTLKLNSPLVKSSVNNNPLIIGEDVEFKVVLNDIPQARILKLDSQDNQVRYGKISAREEIT